MNDRSLDKETSVEILRRAAEVSGLSPQISAHGSGVTPHTIDAYVISPQGEQITRANPELVETAAAQVARELIAAAARIVKEQQRSVPTRPQQEIPVPTTGQPFAQDRPDVRGLRLVGDPHALRVALGTVEVDDVSGETSVTRDTGETYNAFMAGGLVIRLRVSVLIEIAHPNLIGVSAERS